MAISESPAEAIFFTALEKDSPQERARYLAEACGGDTELRSRVERLLGAHPRIGDFLNEPAVATDDLSLDSPILLTPPGTMIGRYKLLEPIGEGGYGTVFMAEQTSPVQRKVALKIIKAGMDTRQVIARFEAERQALALMDHPNIAKVFDAGVTETGRPYFVMELVKGIAITKYCDEHHLPPRARLELFVQVCRAVQHAHQKGIIHRDLKPSNVLVALYDGKAVPKVIDFGVAKATGQRLTDATMFTGFGDVIGTLEYMSPEQAEMNQLDVDTRSDIYSLGVLLYELLTGSTPLEKERIKQAALLEVLRFVREEEPPRPSTRLSASQQLPTIAASRGLEPRKLSGMVHGELDWIVMKALEKDRARRYETANGFAMDVQRYLEDEAVQACPPSATYRFRKFARRNKVILLASTMVMAALVAGTAVSIWQAVRATQARTLADLRLRQADEQRKEAERNFQSACDAVDQMLTEVGQESLAHIPQMEPVRKALLEKALGFYQAFLHERSDDVGLRRQVAKGFARVAGIKALLGDQRQAEQDFRQAVVLLEALPAQAATAAEDQRELARAHGRLAGVLRGTSRRDEAQKEYRAALSVLEALLAAYPDDAAVWEDLADVHLSQAALLRMLTRRADAEQSYTKSIALREKLCDRSPDNAHYRQELARTHFSFALLMNETGRPTESQAAFRRAIELAAQVEKQSPDLEECRNIQAASYTFLGNLLRRDQKLEEAEQAYETSIRLAGGLVRDFPRTVDFRRQLATSHFHMGACQKLRQQSDKALASLRMSLEQYERLVAEAPSVPAYLKELTDCQNELVNLLKASGRGEEAEQVEKQAADAIRREMEAQPGLANNRQQLVQNYLQLVAVAKTSKRFGDAEAAAARAVQTAADLAQQSPDSADFQKLYAICRRERGAVLHELKRAKEAEEEHRQSAAIFVKLTNDYPKEPQYRYQLARCYLNLSLVLRQGQRPWEAEKPARQAVELAPDDPEMLNALGNAFWAQQNYAKAEGVYRSVLRIKPDFTGCRFNLAKMLQNQEKLTEAAAEFREILRVLPRDAATLCELADLLNLHPGVGSAEEALSLAQRAVAVRADTAGYWNTLGLAYYRAGQWKQAQDALEKAMGLRKDGDSTDWMILAMVQWQLGNRKEADQWYEKSVARIEQKNLRSGDVDALRMEAGLLLQRPDPFVHILHAAKLLQEKKDAEAEAALQAAVALKPQTYRAQVRLGSVYAQIGRWQEAAAAYRLAFESREFDPDDVWDWYRGATVSLYVNDVETYRRTCRKMIQTTQPVAQPDAQGQAALVCLLLPDLASPDPLIAKLAEDGTQTSEDQLAFRACILARALVEYRAGHNPGALEWLARLSPKAGGDARDATVFTIQAMAQHRAGNLDAARVAFGNATSIVKNTERDAATRDVSDGNWAALLQSRILYREAESLLQPPGANREEHPAEGARP